MKRVEFLLTWNFLSYISQITFANYLKFKSQIIFSTLVEFIIIIFRHTLFRKIVGFIFSTILSKYLHDIWNENNFGILAESERKTQFQ